MFVGNKVALPDGTYAHVPAKGERIPMSDGMVKVIVELEYAGEHLITLRGPGGDFGWSASVTGSCPDHREEVPSQPGLCGCKPGYELPPAAEESSCVACKAGSYLVNVGSRM